MLKLIFITITILVVTASATNVRQCSKGRPAPLEVNIVGCEEMPCDVVKGSTMLMYVRFVGVAPQTDKLTAKVRATVGIITTPYELSEEVADVCSNLINGAECPIYESEDVVYLFKFLVEDWYPNIAVKVELSLVDENGQSAACFVTDIKVRN